MLNSLNGTYELSITNIDPHSDVDNFTWTSTFIVNVNHPPTISPVSDQASLVPDPHPWGFGAGIVTDPEGLAVTHSLLFNGSSTIPTWILFDNTTFNFTVVSTTNALAADHTLTLVVDDGFNVPTELDFIYTINENKAPVKNMVIDNEAIVNFNYLYVDLYPVDVLFTDPDARPMIPTIRQANGDPIPSFLTFNTINNSMYGIPLDIHVGTWNLEYVATDDYNQEGVIPFKIIVKRKGIFNF